MSAALEYLRELFENGRIVFQGSPPPLRTEDAASVRYLRAVFDDLSKSLAGPPIAFDLAAAIASLRFLEHAAWFLVQSQMTDGVWQGALDFQRGPKSPSEHLSADLGLRWLP